MCFAPQRRALFQHHNFQRCSEPVVFLACWIGNVLHATTTCNFLSLICPDGSTPAALASLLFDLWSQNHWKNPRIRDLSIFPCTCIFFLMTLSLLWSSCFFSSFLWPLLFHLSIVGNLTSKLLSAVTTTTSITTTLHYYYNFNYNYK